MPPSVPATIAVDEDSEPADDAPRPLRREVLAAAVEAAGDSVFVTDATGKIVYANGVFHALNGYASGEAIGRDASILKSGVHGDAFYAGLWRTIAAGRVFRGRITNRRRDGGLYDVDMTISPVRDPETGEIAHYLAIQRDLSRAVAGSITVTSGATATSGASELTREHDRLDALGRVAGGVAHAFNNLLAVIRASGDLALVEVPHGSVLQKQLLEITNAASAAADLTRHLLAFGQRQTLRPRSVEAATAVRGAERLLARILGSDVHLELRVPEEAWSVHVDTQQLEYALVNLAVNARRAMPSGGSFTIEVENVTVEPGEESSSEGVAEPGEYVAITVTDTGVGMDADTRSRAFEPFFTTRADGDGGSGLGLSTVHGIVEQSGGRVTLSSEVGKGTTVRILLPRDTTEQASQPLAAGLTVPPTREGPAPPSSEDSAEASPGLEPAAVASTEPVAGPAEEPHDGEERRSDVGMETILIVEDFAAVRRAAERSLQRVGYHVLSAGDQAEALRVVSEHRGSIDLVLSDVVLGEERGPEVVRKLAEVVPELRVLFMSGYTGDDARGAIPADAPFIAKPFSFESLSRAVRDALNGPIWKPPNG